jgi:hypothetical protein
MAGRFRFAHPVRERAAPAGVGARPSRVAATRLGRALAELRTRRVGRPSWRWRTYRGRGVPESWWRTLRTTLAAVLSYELARRLLPGPAPLLAPLTCLLVAQLTVFETVRSGWQRIGSVVAGVLVAVLLSKVVGLTWWGLGLVILAALFIGVFLHLGEHQLEVPISAMLVLAVTGGAEAAALSRVLETLIGALTGVAVSTVLAPPVYVRPAAEAIGDLADDLAELLAAMGEELTDAWSMGRARAWLARTQELDGPLRVAEEALNRGETSLRLNPRGRHLHEGASSLRAGLATLEHVAVQVRALCRDLSDLAEVIEERGGAEPEVLVALGRLLVELGECVAAFGQLVAPGVEGPPLEAVPLRIAVEIARTHRDVFAELMGVDFRADPALWHIQGALLADVDRLLREIDLDRGPDARNVRHR